MNKQELVDVTCRACNKSTHIIRECPMVCGYPNRAKVLLNYRRNIPSDRVKYRRKIERKISTRKESLDIRNSIYLYMCKTQMVSQEIDDQRCLFDSRGASFADSANDEIIENQQEVDKEVLNSTILALDRNSRLSKQYGKRKLTFQACTDALKDEEIRDRILEVIGKIQRAERQSLRQNNVSNQNVQQMQLNARQQNHQNTVLSNKSNQDSDKKTSEQVRDQQRRQTKIIITPFIKVNDNSMEYLYLNKNLEEEQGKKMGQYLEIFEGFDKVKNFEYFLKHNNIREIAQKFKGLIKNQRIRNQNKLETIKFI